MLANAIPDIGFVKTLNVKALLQRRPTRCYAFRALGMQRVGLTHPGGNEPIRGIAEKLGFNFEGIQGRANMLPSGKCADRYCYARFDLADLPHLEVSWEGLQVKSEG